MEAQGEENQMMPFLSIASRELERDLNGLKLVLDQLEKRTHSENACPFSERRKWQLDGGFMTYM